MKNLHAMRLMHLITVCSVNVTGVFADRQIRSIGMLDGDTSNVLKDIIDGINPYLLVGVGLLIIAGCAFEMVHGSRASTRGRTTHIASRHNNTAPFSIA